MAQQTSVDVLDNVLGITEITIIDSNPLLVLENINKISDRIKIDKQENLITVKTDDIKISFYRCPPISFL